MSRTVIVASECDRNGARVSLTMTVEGTETIWTVRYSDGGIWGVSPFNHEVDARREYDRKRRLVGALA